MLLNCHTYYSLNYGTLSIDALFDELERNGYDSFVISDINTTSACVEIARRCMAGKSDEQERKLKPVMGIDFRNGIRQKYVGIAMNNEGFRQLNDHLSSHLHKGMDFPEQAPYLSHAYIVYPLQAYKGWALHENEYIGVTPKDLLTLPFSAAAAQKHKLVILQPVSFSSKQNYNAHRLLRAIEKNTLLSKLPKTEQAEPDNVMPMKAILLKQFEAYPQAVANTDHILKSCSIDFGFGKFANKNPKHYMGSVQEDLDLLRKLSIEGMAYRYPNISDVVKERMEKELAIIAQMNFASYFLINWDIIQYAQHKNYYYVGRGSGANSLVAYLLRITDVDPIELDLYFERFINPARTNPPDFDIDFSWTDRDDMTEYIFDKFGGKEGRAALLGTYSTYQKDAVIRELGKVFGLPPAEIDRLQSADAAHADEFGRLVLKYSSLIHDFPSHLSIHASGIVISEEPITAYCGTFMPPKGYQTTQFSMLEAEDIGLYKFDILSQRGLGKIKDTLEIVKENKGVEIDIHAIEQFKRDEKVKELLRVGKTIGCFYVESPAMRMLLAKLHADDYLRLVAASSIIRPGVAKSGMMREYILRYRHEHLREKARQHIPELYEILKETYGVMVYQEDVIKVAHLFAGLSLSEADYLRRGMSWKFKQRSEFWRVKENFIAKCKAKGLDSTTVNNVWNQIESFANFAFSKGHSASYAVESYQALFLKAYYPLEYLTATLNNGGGFYKMELYIHEARMHGADIQAPCVNNSDTLCLIKNNSIYLGLGFIASLEKPMVQHILQERKENGAYQSLYDFVKRTGVSSEQARLLIRVGAMRFTGKNKKELLWEMHNLISPVKKHRQAHSLFETETKTYHLPELTNEWYDDAFDEIELLGFTLGSPFRLLQEEPEYRIKAKDLLNYKDQTVEIIGYMIAVKNTYTTKGERMYFGTFIDVAGHWIDTVHFPPVAKAFPFKGPGCYRLTGKVTEEFDFTTLEISAMERLAVIDREHA